MDAARRPTVPSELAVDAELEVVEGADAFHVVVRGDADDWLVRFEKADGFAAAAWADNMARVHNERRARRGEDPRWGARSPL
ncbi:MAG TPA: hypothetical protein VFG31_10820 [Conexibacter sp.]|nr:hypothetical protein [Conexibacter sp.]